MLSAAAGYLRWWDMQGGMTSEAHKLAFLSRPDFKSEILSIFQPWMRNSGRKTSETGSRGMLIVITSHSTAMNSQTKVDSNIQPKLSGASAIRL
jgi:hypothetical protein